MGGIHYEQILWRVTNTSEKVEVADASWSATKMQF